MTDWRPIETAPKDGTEILAWDGVFNLASWWDGNGNEKLAGWFTPEIAINPDYWMPLPPPPQDGEK